MAAEPLLEIFLSHSTVSWRDWYTYDVVNATSRANMTLSTPLGHINAHIHNGTALLLYPQLVHTIAKTRVGS
jgi:alpha-glucosidase